MCLKQILPMPLNEITMSELFFFSHRNASIINIQFHYCIRFTSFVFKSAASIYEFGLGNKGKFNTCLSMNTSSVLPDHTDRFLKIL